MASLVGLYHQAISFIRYDLWRIQDHELTKFKRLSYRLLKTILLAIRGFITEKLNIRASALTYSIIFAMIPTFAIMIAIGKGLGVEKMIEDSLQGTFIGEANITSTIMGFVKRYLESTQKGIFIGVGIVILFWSVINFFMQVENAFNTIWHVKKSRSFVNMISTYFSTVLIIPILIVVTGGFSVYISSSIQQSYIYEVLSPLLRFVFKLLPYVVNCLVFTVMYMAVPNTKVKLVHAAVAGVVAGCAFQAFQMLYINGQVYLSRYNVVYGGFAAIPLLLLWTQISCLIILLGAEIAYVSQNLKFYEYELETRKISPRYRNFLTLYILHIVVIAFVEARPSLTAQQIEKDYKLPLRVILESLKWLTRMGLITEIITDRSKEKRYMPAFDVHQMTVQMVVSKMDSFGIEEFMTGKNTKLADFKERAFKYCERIPDVNDQLLIKDL